MSKWTKEQEEAITKVGTNIIVSAGAGSGKTAVLTERTIRKLLNGGNINRLLILTFTNAAAGEMKNRIRTELKKANLKEQLDYIDEAYITTFDSFSLSIVKKYHYILNIPNSISIMDKSIETLKSKEILDDIFENMYDDVNFNKLINDFCIKTDDTMKEIVKTISYKLDLLSNKDEYLSAYIDNHYNQEYINKFVDLYLENIYELKESIKDLYKELISRVDNKFIQSYNIEPLINSKTYSEIKINLNIIGSPRKNKNCESDYKIYKDNITKILDKLKVLTRFDDINMITNSYLETKSYVEAIIKIIKKFDEKFNEYKKSNNLYTFTDVAHMAIKVVKENSFIKEELKQSFDEIMVDEYQDTSDLQEEFINLIANNNLYMVGDIKQSIYRFRNANPNIFKNKYEAYKNGVGGIKIDLLKNFRSRPEVVNNINLIFNLIMDENIGDANYKETHQMNFGNTKYIEDFKLDVDCNMDILKYEEDKKYSNDEIEAFITALDIKEKIENKYKVVDKKTNTLRDCTYSDFAIIMDRGTSFDLYKKIFEYIGIPIIQIQNEKLSLGTDIIVLKNLINLIVKINLNELDDEFKYLYTSVSRSFLFKMSDEDIFNIIRFNKFNETELFIKCKNINIDEISNLDLINQIVKDFNFYEKLITTNNINEAMIRLDYLKDISISLSNIGYSPIDFSNYLKNILTLDDFEYKLQSDDTNSVKILNIHKSKGLEYSICYFTGLKKKSNNEDIKAKFIVDSNYNIITPYIDDGIKQTMLKDLLVNKENKESISEKIRLFYVALTRAREKIIIITPLNLEVESYDNLVPDDVRLNYNKILDMLESIGCALTKYIKNIDVTKLNISRDYEKIKSYNYKDNVDKVDTKIEKFYNDINYEVINESKFSKNTTKLITKEEYNNLKNGTYLHYIFEMEDFKNTTNPYVLKFIKHIDKNYINCYKEFEFIYEHDNIYKRGIIDLMLEYADHIDIIDYKTKSIDDDDYLDQLIGYKTYIEGITNKEVYIYLYSILDDNLRKIN